MTLKFPECKYKVNLYERNDDGSLGFFYLTETFATQKEAEEYLNLRSKTENFHYSVQVLCSVKSSDELCCC